MSEITEWLFGGTTNWVIILKIPRRVRWMVEKKIKSKRVKINNMKLRTVQREKKEKKNPNPIPPHR